VLAAVLLTDEPLHVRAIADRTGLPYSVVQREVDRLEEVGLVRSSRVGAARVVRRVLGHLLDPELRQLLLKTYGPAEVLPELVGRLAGVREAFLFGSWAARYHGEWGEDPADIDVLLVGCPDEASVEELEADAEDRLGRPVEVTVISPEAWGEQRDGFVKTVRTRPLVPLEIGNK
jgi:predicted nucleotidyltransferase